TFTMSPRLPRLSTWSRRMTSMISFPSIRRVRQQRELPCTNDGHAQPALMLRARAGNPPRQHFAALGNEAAQQLDVLVVDVVDLVRAELADLATTKEPAAALTRAGLVARLGVLAAAAAPAVLLRSIKRHDLGLQIGAIEHHVA